jgi:hypothetical protein
VRRGINRTIVPSSLDSGTVGGWVGVALGGRLDLANLDRPVCTGYQNTQRKARYWRAAKMRLVDEGATDRSHSTGQDAGFKTWHCREAITVLV